MKVFFKGDFYFTDNEICLVKALREKGIKLRYYIPVEKGKQRAALLDIKEIYPKTGIFPASVYKEFEPYSKYIDLNDIYVINSPQRSWFHPLNILLRIKLIIEYFRFNPDVFYFTSALPRSWWFLYWLKGVKVLTVHDPIPHSGSENKTSEMLRKKAFAKSDRFVLLSNGLVDSFAKRYSIPVDKISIANLGVFDYLESLQYYKPDIKSLYILFFGQIFPYKGLEYLLPAMEKVHISHPDVKLVVAGGGKMYFDISPYKDKEYIIIDNRYIPMIELVGLLRNCLFSVAPYKDATQSGLLLNSFSLNVPMIVTNVGAFPEVVKDGVYGKIVEPCDIDVLANAINSLLADHECLNRMRTNLNQWKIEMNWKDIADIFVSVFDSALKDKEKL